MYWKKGPSFSRRLELKVENDLRSSKHEKMISLALSMEKKGGLVELCFFCMLFQFWNFPFSRESIGNCIIAKHKKIQKERRKMKKNPFIVFKQAWKLRQRLQSSGGKCTSLKLWQLNGWRSIEVSTLIVWKYQSKAIVCWNENAIGTFSRLFAVLPTSSLTYLLRMSSVKACLVIL